MPASCLPDVGENLVGEQLTGQVLGAVEEDLVVFGPEAHHLLARFIDPVFEVEQRVPDGVGQFRRKMGAICKLIEDAQQADGAEIGAVLALGHKLQRLVDHRFVDGLTEREAADLREEAGAPAYRLGSRREVQE